MDILYFPSNRLLSYSNTRTVPTNRSNSTNQPSRANKQVNYLGNSLHQQEKESPTTGTPF